MCLLQAQAPRWELRMCLLQAQAPCNKRIGGWACRSHCGWNFCVCFYITKSTEILWNDGVFEFPKEHQRCSRKHTNFNAIEIMCLRQAQAPCNKSLVAELVEATMCGIFVFALITQSPRRFCWNDCVFEFPKEHQRCSRKHTDFNKIEIMVPSTGSGTEMRSENVPSTGSGSVSSNK